MAAEGVVLAAGLSSRAGTYKMTLDFNGRTMIEHVIDCMAGFVKRIIVVGGYGIEKLEPVLKGYENVSLVYNEDYNMGMFTSVKKGISCVTEDSFFLTPGDYPLIKPCVYEALLSADGDAAIPVYEGRKGHPVLIKSSFIEDILYEGRYLSLREFINTRKVELIPVECRGILVDVDTMDDYRYAAGIKDGAEGGLQL